MHLPSKPIDMRKKLWNCLKFGRPLCDTIQCFTENCQTYPDVECSCPVLKQSDLQKLLLSIISSKNMNRTWKLHFRSKPIVKINKFINLFDSGLPLYHTVECFSAFCQTYPGVKHSSTVVNKSDLRKLLLYIISSPNTNKTQKMHLRSKPHNNTKN